LHVNYSGTQLQYALAQLSSDKKIKLVTLGIGANDVLITLALCSLPGGDFSACLTNQMPITLSLYGQNLATILTAIRGEYKGTITLVKFYSPSASLNDIVRSLNDVMARVGQSFGARIADGYTAFQLASAPYGGDPCAAGLLIKVPQGGCDIHPSPIGQALLAAAVEVSLQ
jgi:lysophospholipase L1-like esterase